MPTPFHQLTSAATSSSPRAIRPAGATELPTPEGAGTQVCRPRIRRSQSMRTESERKTERSAPTSWRTPRVRG